MEINGDCYYHSPQSKRRYRIVINEVPRPSALTKFTGKLGQAQGQLTIHYYYLEWSIFMHSRSPAGEEEGRRNEMRR